MDEAGDVRRDREGQTVCDRKTGRQTERETERQRERQRQKQTERERELELGNFNLQGLQFSFSQNLTNK